MSTPTAWSSRSERGRAGELHALAPDAALGRQLWHLAVTAPALVLGSAQRDDVDPAAAQLAGVEVVRRRSGGGAVLLVPGESLWVDLIVPRDDELWDDDITRSFDWLGDLWASVIRDAGVAGAVEVHRGGLVAGPLGRSVCFAGIGPGEVALDGAKLVGLSQRRTREASRFQCTVHAVWQAESYRRLLPAAFAAGGSGADGVGLPPVATWDGDLGDLLVAFRAALART